GRPPVRAAAAGARRRRPPLRRRRQPDAVAPAGRDRRTAAPAAGVGLRAGGCELATARIGAPPGPTLRALTAHATGNPLYLRELLDALVREELVQVENGLAEGPGGAGYEAPW